MAEVSTINELIRIGKTKNITYYKTSILETIQNIECSTKNIFLDYIDELLDISVNVTLTDNEYFKYMYRPKLLAYDIYNDTDLYFLIMLINNINNEKDFNLKTLKIIPPKDLKTIHDIYNAEFKFLRRSNTTDYATPTSSNNIDYSSYNIISKFETTQRDSINTDLSELKQEIENLKQTIRDIIGELIKDDLDQIMLDLILQEVERIKNTLEVLIVDKIAEIFNDHNILNRISHMEREVITIKSALNGLLNLDIENRLLLLEEKSILLKDRLELLENSIGDIVNNNIRDEINNLIQDFNTFKDEIYRLISEGPNIDLDPILDEIARLKDSLSKLSGVSTRDIVFMIQTPITAGIQSDTEFFVPYKGRIEQVIMSVGVDTSLKSNLIVQLQKYNMSSHIWSTSAIYEMNATDVYIIQDVAMDINNEYIRLVLDAGDYTYVSNGINFVIRVLEDREDPNNPQ